MTSPTYAAQFMDLLRLSADDRLLKAMKQPLAVFKRETYRLGLKCLTRTIDSTDHFTPVGDQPDANDDLHGDLGTAIEVLKSCPTDGYPQLLNTPAGLCPIRSGDSGKGQTAGVF